MTTTRSLIVGFLFLGTTGATAQVEFGLKGGPTYYFQSTSEGDDVPAGSDAPKSYSGPGFHLGVFLQYELSEKINLRPELQFSSRYTTESYRKSVQLGDTTTSQTADITRSQTYLELPVLLGYQVSEKFGLHLGPAFGFLLGSKITTTGSTTVTTPGGTTTTSLDNSLSTTDGLRPVEIAGVVGAAYRFGGRLEIGLRYWRGFTTLEEEPDLQKTYQNQVQAWFGYVLNGE